MSQDTDPLPKTISNSPSDWFKKIAIVRTDVQRKDFITEEAFIAEQEVILRSEQTAETIESEFSIQTQIFAADDNLFTNLQKFSPNLCINFVDTVKGQGALAAGVPGVFDILNIPYVGAGTLSLSLNTNKFLTKTLLEAWDIPTPRYQLLRTSGQELEYDFRFPLIAKLNEEHGSVAIHDDSVVTNEQELRKRVKWLLETYKQPVLIEEFVDSATEITGLVLEGKNTNIFLAERAFEKPEENRFKLLSFETKWATDLGMSEPVEYRKISELSKKTIQAIKKDLKRAFDILRMDDIGRFDIMIDKYENYYFIDSNANPSLGPESSAARAAEVSNTSFLQVMRHILLHNYLEIQKIKKIPSE